MAEPQQPKKTVVSLVADYLTSKKETKSEGGTTVANDAVQGIADGAATRHMKDQAMQHLVKRGKEEGT